MRRRLLLVIVGTVTVALVVSGVGTYLLLLRDARSVTARDLARQARRMERAIWQHMPEMDPVTDSAFGEYQDAGVTPDREVITYCQGGYRAAHSYLALRLVGYPRVRNYLGSWKEWGDRTDLPVTVP